MDEAARQQILDEEHLKLLRIGYFVMGGTAGLGVLFGLMYVLMGMFVFAATAAAPRTASEVPPALFSWIFIAVGAFIVLFAAAYAILSLLTAKALRLRRSRVLCLVTAAITSLHLPFGTVMGVLTFSVLERPTVRAMFAAGSAAAPGATTSGGV